VSVNIVNHPPQYSLNGLPRSELGAIVRSWERGDAAVRRQLRRHRPVWARQLSRLQTQLEHTEPQPEYFYLTSVSARIAEGRNQADVARKAPTPRLAAGRFGRWLIRVGGATNQPPVEDPGGSRTAPAEAPTMESARASLARWSKGAAVDELLIDGQDVVSYSSTRFAGLEADRIVGRSITEVLMALRERYGPDADVTHEEIGPWHMDRIVDFADGRGHRTSVRWIAIAREDTGERPPVMVWATVRLEEATNATEPLRENDMFRVR
jgi:hypothetical protein